MKVPPENRAELSRKKRMERACRPDSVSRFPSPTVIPLGAQLPARSSHLPARSGGPPCPAQAGSRAYLVLLRVGFGLPFMSP